MVVVRFSSMEELISRANDTTYGLAAGVLTSNIDNALTFAQVRNWRTLVRLHVSNLPPQAVQAGSVWVNCFLANMPQVLYCTVLYCTVLYY